MKIIPVISLYLTMFLSSEAYSQFRDNFIGKYYCFVKIQTSTQTGSDHRNLYVSIDPAYPNRVILTDSLSSPGQFINPVNLYADSTFRDTIWSASGGLFYGHFYNLDSIYFHRAVPLGPGGGALLEYWGKKHPAAVGIKETELENAIVVFPTPASQKLFIKTQNGFEIETCRLYALNGKELALYETEKGEYDTSSLPKGTYFLQIKSAKAIITKKIIIEH